MPSFAASRSTTCVSAGKLFARHRLCSVRRQRNLVGVEVCGEVHRDRNHEGQNHAVLAADAVANASSSSIRATSRSVDLKVFMRSVPIRQAAVSCNLACHIHIRRGRPSSDATRQIRAAQCPPQHDVECRLLLGILRLVRRPARRSVSSSNSSSFRACSNGFPPEAATVAGACGALKQRGSGDCEYRPQAEAPLQPPQPPGLLFSMIPAPTTRASPRPVRIHHLYFAHGSLVPSGSPGAPSPPPGRELLAPV